MSLGLLLLFVFISSANLSLGFFLGRWFHAPTVASEAAEGHPAEAHAEKPAEKPHGHH